MMRPPPFVHAAVALVAILALPAPGPASSVQEEPDPCGFQSSNCLERCQTSYDWYGASGQGPDPCLTFDAADLRDDSGQCQQVNPPIGLSKCQQAGEQGCDFWGTLKVSQVTIGSCSDYRFQILRNDETFIPIDEGGAVTEIQFGSEEEPTDKACGQWEFFEVHRQERTQDPEEDAWLILGTYIWACCACEKAPEQN